MGKRCVIYPRSFGEEEKVMGSSQGPSEKKKKKKKNVGNKKDCVGPSKDVNMVDWKKKNSGDSKKSDNVQKKKVFYYGCFLCGGLHHAKDCPQEGERKNPHC
ncbi:unnamed protein product [Ilex paraguariensis]|uniref:Uncharacterized protein n=1 Tax=Ilex paraguariensis TaxID=185542 RepID=A0ABC8TRR4_9AQUA